MWGGNVFFLIDLRSAIPVQGKFTSSWATVLAWAPRTAEPEVRACGQVIILGSDSREPKWGTEQAETGRDPVCSWTWLLLWRMGPEADSGPDLIKPAWGMERTRTLQQSAGHTRATGVEGQGSFQELPSPFQSAVPVKPDGCFPCLSSWAFIAAARGKHADVAPAFYPCPAGRSSLP